MLAECSFLAVRIIHLKYFRSTNPWLAFKQKSLHSSVQERVLNSQAKANIMCAFICGVFLNQDSVLKLLMELLEIHF